MSTALLWSTQYIAAMLVGLAISLRILHKERRVWANNLLIIYSILISAWSLSVFIHRTTPYLEISEFFFRAGAISLFLAQSIYLCMAFSIRSPKKRYLLATLPSFIASILYLGYGEFRFTYTSFGWSYSLAGDLLSQIARGVTNEAYNLAILLTLYFLYRGATNPLLKRKLSILLFTYLIFQFIGFSATNLLLVLGGDVPPFGGILHIGTFIAMGYALTLKPRLTPPYLPTADFSGRYARFLNRLLEALPGEALGQRYVLFTQFVKETDIEPYVRYVGDQPIFVESLPPTIVSTIEKTLDYLYEHKLVSLLDSYLPVINAAYTKLSTQEAHKLDEVLLKRVEFLTAGDIFYGIDGGRLMQKIEVDKSLNNVPETEAALRIYKRILLAAFPDFIEVLGSELLNRLLLYDVLKDIDADIDGHISISKCLEKHKQDPPMKIITIFNSFLSSAISQAADTTPRVANVILGKVNRILELNWRRATKLGIITTFRTDFGDLIGEPLTLPLLNEPVTADTFKASTLILGQPLEENAGQAILLEFTTASHLQIVLRRLTIEALAKGYETAVFTRRGSAVEEKLTPLDVKFIYLTLTRRTQTETSKAYIAMKDPSEVLAALTELNLSSTSLVILDNLTDFILTIGFDKAYTFLRHLVEISAETGATILLGLNIEAHSKQEVAALESLANLTVNLETKIKILER